MQNRTILLTIIAAAVAVRLLFCFVLFPQFLAEGSTVGTHYFFDSYREIATALVTTGEFTLGPHGVRALHRPPGYVALLVAALPGSEHTRVLFQLYHALLGGLACLVTYFLARAVAISRRASLAAAAVVAFWPFLVWETKVTVPENLVVVLLPLTCLALIRTIKPPSLLSGEDRPLTPPSPLRGEGRGEGRRWRTPLESPLPWPAIAGLLTAISALTHALHQIMIPAGILLLIFGSTISWKKRIVSAIVFAIVASAPVAAWSWRNRVEADYGGVATGFGHHYWMGIFTYELLQRDFVSYFRDNGPAATAAVNERLRAHGYGPIDTNEARADPERNRFLDRTAMAHALANPAFTFGKVMVKAPLAWVQQQSPPRAALNAFLLLPLLIPAIAGAIRGGRALIPIWLPLVLLNLGAAFVFVEGAPMRYALPWIPLAAVLAAGALRGIED